MLAQCGRDFGGLWLYFGDFNVVIDQCDIYGGRPVGSSNAGVMNWFMTQEGMIDLGFIGNHYTWSNRQHGRAFI